MRPPRDYTAKHYVCTWPGCNNRATRDALVEMPLRGGGAHLEIATVCDLHTDDDEADDDEADEVERQWWQAHG
jgi:hypothetical protein